MDVSQTWLFVHMWGFHTPLFHFRLAPLFSHLGVFKTTLYQPERNTNSSSAVPAWNLAREPTIIYLLSTHFQAYVILPDVSSHSIFIAILLSFTTHCGIIVWTIVYCHRHSNILSHLFVLFQSIVFILRFSMSLVTWW